MPDRKERNMDNRPIPQPPVHYLSALITIVLDAVWGLPELAATGTGVGIIAVPFLVMATGVSCFFAVLGIQRFIAHDGWGSAFAKAVVMSIIAGVPYMVTGTAAGTILLGWAGASNLSRILSRRSDTPQLPDSPSRKT
jgi:hypothetical protein